jgi:hypothetical protein
MNNSTKAPAHLWIVGLLAVLWNAIGAFDYTATEYRLDFYMSQFNEQQLDYFYGFPAWAVAAWAIAVWSSLLGSLGLLLRKSWAVWLFGAGLAGLAVSTFYNFVITDGIAVMGTGGAWFTGVIWFIALALFLYARGLSRRGVLT